MKNLHLFFLAVSLLFFAACGQPDGADGQGLIETVTGGGEEGEDNTFTGFTGDGTLSSPGISTYNKALDNIPVNGAVVGSVADAKTHGTGFSYGTLYSSIFSGWNSAIWNIPTGVFMEGGALPVFW